MPVTPDPGATNSTLEKVEGLKASGSSTGNSSSEAVIISLSTVATKSLTESASSSNLSGTTSDPASQKPLEDVYDALAHVITSASFSDSQKLAAYKAFEVDAAVRDNALGRLDFHSGPEDSRFLAAIDNSTFGEAIRNVDQGNANGSALDVGIADIQKQASDLTGNEINGLLSSVSSSISVVTGSDGSVSVESSLSQIFGNSNDSVASRLEQPPSTASRTTSGPPATVLTENDIFQSSESANATGALAILASYQASQNYPKESGPSSRISPNAAQIGSQL